MASIITIEGLPGGAGDVLPEPPEPGPVDYIDIARFDWTIETDEFELAEAEALRDLVELESDIERRHSSIVEGLATEEIDIGNLALQLQTSGQDLAREMSPETREEFAPLLDDLPAIDELRVNALAWLPLDDAAETDLPLETPPDEIPLEPEVT